MSTLHETEIDGVRTFWVETGRPTLAARLMFRQGYADEPLTESGWLHLLEHLALTGRGGGALDVNGSVSPLLLSLDAHGPVDAVAAHLAELTRWLSEPDLERAQHERGVLRAEARLRTGPVPRAFSWRYGAAGPGVSAFAELGLGRATPEALAERARRVLTRGNAVLVLDGPPPEGLTLTLPEGRLLLPAAAVPIETTQGCYEEGAGLLMSGVVPRGHGATFVPSLLEREVRAELRERSAGAYAPYSFYEGIDQDVAMVAVGADLSPELLPEVVERALGISRRLAQHGPEAEHLEEEVQRRVQSMLDPYAAVGLAMRAGASVLKGEEPESFDQLMDELRATSVEEVQAAASPFHAALLIGAPGGASRPQDLRFISFPEHAPGRDGKAHRHRDWPAARTRLVVTPERVEMAYDDVAREIRLERLAAMVTESDGTRHVIDRDGWTLTVDPAAWHGGAEAVAVLDRAVPEGLVVPGPDPTGEPFARASFAQRWRGGLRGPLGRKVLWALAVPGLLVLLGFAVATGHPLPLVALAVIVVRVVRDLGRRRS